MSNPDVWAEWVREVKTELKDRHDENIQQRIDFEKLRTEIRTRNKIIWALIGLVLTIMAVVIAALKLLNT